MNTKSEMDIRLKLFKNRSTEKDIDQNRSHGLDIQKWKECI